MKSNGLFILSIIATFMIMSCASTATDEEINKMCTNLEKVRGSITVPSKEDALKKINDDFSKKRAKLEAWKAKEMKGWDDELAAKLKELEESDTGSKSKKVKKSDDEEKKPTPEELKSAYAKKKEIGAKQFDADLANLPAQKKMAVEAVQQKIDSKQAELDASIKKCIEDAKKEGVSQKVAQCRIAAQNKDSYWNKCR